MTDGRGSPRRGTRAWLAAGALLLMVAGGPRASAQDTLEGFVWLERPVPEIIFADATGAPRTLADFKDRIVLLNLWATWCVPCREEMPSLDRLQKKLGGADFMVLPLSLDKGGRAVIEEFYAEFGIEHLGIYVDPTVRAGMELGAVGIPTTLLISAEGVELGRKIGPAEWDSPEALALIGSYLMATTGGDCACPMGRMGTAKPPSSSEAEAGSANTQP